jgi:hypothetical protein
LRKILGPIPINGKKNLSDVLGGGEIRPLEIMCLRSASCGIQIQAVAQKDQDELLVAITCEKKDNYYFDDYVSFR